MPNGSSGGGQNPPSWWSVDLYAFVNNEFPLEGWIWEFSRRAILQEIFPDRPVEAMNPEPDLDSVNPNYWDLYKPWNHRKWSQKHPMFLPPAVNLEGRWPRGFAGQRYRIGDYGLKQLVKVTVDINRRDSVIIRDFRAVLEELRREMPPPEKVQPRVRDWLANHILAVWDLRKYDVSWFAIARLLGFGNPDEDRYQAIDIAKNSYNPVRIYIDEGGWLKLARYIETPQVGRMNEIHSDNDS